MFSKPLLTLSEGFPTCSRVPTPMHPEHITSVTHADIISCQLSFKIPWFWGLFFLTLYLLSSFPIHVLCLRQGSWEYLGCLSITHQPWRCINPVSGNLSKPFSWSSWLCVLRHRVLLSEGSPDGPLALPTSSRQGICGRKMLRRCVLLLDYSLGAWESGVPVKTSTSLLAGPVSLVHSESKKYKRSW